MNDFQRRYVRPVAHDVLIQRISYTDAVTKLQDAGFTNGASLLLYYGIKL